MNQYLHVNARSALQQGYNKEIENPRQKRKKEKLPGFEMWEIMRRSPIIGSTTIKLRRGRCIGSQPTPVLRTGTRHFGIPLSSDEEPSRKNGKYSGQYNYFSGLCTPRSTGTTDACVDASGHAKGACSPVINLRLPPEVLIPVSSHFGPLQVLTGYRTSRHIETKLCHVG